MSGHWGRLVQDAGFQDPASWYALSRASATGIHGKFISLNMLMILTISVSAPRPILVQVMGHNDSQIFARHCRSQSVLWDTQNKYSRAPLNAELVHMASNTNRLNWDPRAPTELTDEQEKEMVHANPEVAEKQKRIQDLAAECVRSSSASIYYSSTI